MENHLKNGRARNTEEKHTHTAQHENNKGEKNGSIFYDIFIIVIIFEHQQ